MMEIRIANRKIGPGNPVYFIADIAANHDGDLNRAKELIFLATKAGADAAKFQNFRAEQIVSKKGFDSLSSQLSHQKKWKKPVFEVYKDASLPWEWTPQLKKYCSEAGIEYMSTPYDLDTVDMLDPFLNAYKIGSGDIDWLEELEYIAHKNKPVILSTGAATVEDVDRAVKCILEVNPQLAVLQCNTNYTGSEENLKSVNLRVIETYKNRYPKCVIGLSDHTPGHSAVLGAVALGACIVEKHFTDDTSREGPDHPFSLDFDAWKAMVDDTRKLENALGDGIKRIEENEKETQFIQRRCVRALRNIKAGTKIERSDITVLRPLTEDAILPHEIGDVIGKIAARDIKEENAIRWIDLDMQTSKLETSKLVNSNPRATTSQTA